MLVTILVLIGLVLLALGATLYAFSKSGEQEIIGGVLIMVGIIAAMVGGLCWWAGL